MNIRNVTPVHPIQRVLDVRSPPSKSLWQRFLDCFRGTRQSPSNPREVEAAREKKMAKLSVISNLLNSIDVLSEHARPLAREMRLFSSMEVSKDSAQKLRAALLTGKESPIGERKHWNYVLNTLNRLHELDGKGMQTFGDCKTYNAFQPLTQCAKRLSDFLSTMQDEVAFIIDETKPAEHLTFKSAPHKLVDMLLETYNDFDEYRDDLEGRDWLEYRANLSDASKTIYGHVANQLDELRALARNTLKTLDAEPVAEAKQKVSKFAAINAFFSKCYKGC
jgi:hypothetical protein